VTEQLNRGLRRLAADDPATWRAIVRGHADVITGWAATDNAFFDQVADLVTFRTTRGMLNLPDYLALTDRSLFYVTRELGSLQEQMLAEGHAVPVIDAHYFAVQPFLAKYASRHPDLRLVPLDGEARHLFRPVAPAPFAALLDFYREHGIAARVAAFRPLEAPAVMVYPDDAELIHDARAALADGEMPDAIAAFVADYVNDRAPDNAALRGTLYLNASSGLIQQLASQPPNEAVLTLVHQIARVFSGRMLNAGDATEAFGAISRALGELAA
jgi:hypothetical protein